MKAPLITTVIFIQALIFFCPWIETALCDPGPAADAIDSVKISLMLQHYTSAQLTVKKLLTENPGNIEALYLGSAIRQTQILDYESYTIESKRSIETAESAFSAISKVAGLQTGKDSTDRMFYLGSILGGIGVINAKNGNWPGAIKKAFSSVNYFKKILSRDSTYYAGYFGVGVFNYYLSKQLNWLPFFGDKRREAINQLQNATHAAFPYDYIACNSLCWIYIERNELNAADSIASSVLSKYPDNTLFLRIKVRIDLTNRNWNDALTWAARLMELSLKRNPINWADLVSAYQAMVCCYEGLSRGEESLKAAQTALSLPIPQEFRKIPFVTRHLKYILEILKKYAGR